MLGSYGADLAPHLAFMLNSVGYSPFSAISKIDGKKITEIQTFIQFLFADESKVEDLKK